MKLLVLLSLLGSPFDLPEPEVAPSPRAAQSLALPPGESVIDFDVSPVRPEAALVIKTAAGHQRLGFWEIGDGATRSLALPDELKISAIAWHPLGQSLFLLAARGKQQEILETPAASWSPTTIYRSAAPLRRLVIGPRPYDVGGMNATVLAYRVFFAVKRPDGTYAARTVTEDGKGEYAVIDAKREARSEEDGEPPSELTAASALPVGFHPAGQVLIWEDEKHCFQKAVYGGSSWWETLPVLAGQAVCKGSLTYTPNGAGLLQWQSGTNGATLRLGGGAKAVVVAPDLRFESTPSSVPDGRGLVGVVKEGAGLRIRYVPIDVPLADVVNAWMFLETPRDRELLAANTGLFRPLSDDQLYQLYDTENYSCGYYDSSTPTRPYLVTTDIFWELYAAAFEGTFILTERQGAVASFWKFVQGANESLKGQPSRAAAAFAALVAVRDGNEANPEAAKILRSEGMARSAVTGRDFDFGNLKPRSHYARDPALQRYFRAFRYLTDLKLQGEDLEPLRKLPPPVIGDARAWIGAYLPFIAPPRERVIWDSGTQVFPLSWGLDNEVMDRVVFHPNLPRDEQITGPEGPRLLPTGLDFPAVLGSALAEALLDESGELRKYPPLRPRLAALRKRFEGTRSRPGESLYERWLSGLANQWAEDVVSPGGAIDRKLWARKRLQTGLASWATLRHATLLVNARGEAECGEAGFEPIVLRPPRGYVEPDPATFDAIAGLFDATAQVVKARVEEETLRDGLLVRLDESRQKTVLFRDLARKELAGQPFTTQEYEEILYVGRAAEHNFLIFKSLAGDDFALSTPDPIPKIADVAGGGGRLLLAGVGRPLEWDQVVPFFGRKEVVKGSTYSYYETVSGQVLDDAEWRKQLPSMKRPGWIDPYLTTGPLTCPARAP